MDDFARLPSDERRVYFEQTAARLRMSAQIIEKDFWVCWSLKRLFSLDDFRSHLTFKGGTSLSKVYGVIERFSEDVDVAIERDYLGFGGDKEPEKGASGKEQQRRIRELGEACRAMRSKLEVTLCFVLCGVKCITVLFFTCGRFFAISRAASETNPESV